jgi:spectinomycin phosphotransferase
MKQAISDERIIDCLNTQYGIKLAKLTFLPIGADMNASVYKTKARSSS